MAPLFVGTIVSPNVILSAPDHKWRIYHAHQIVVLFRLPSLATFTLGGVRENGPKRQLQEACQDGALRLMPNQPTERMRDSASASFAASESSAIASLSRVHPG